MIIPKVEIKIIATIDPGCFGVLLVDGIPIALTLWRTYSNAENPGEPVKILPGTYICKRSVYHKPKVPYETFEIIVPGHSRILFHIGNVETDSEGCCLVGEEFGTMNGKPAILRSGAGFGEFMTKMSGVNEFPLVVI